ncbi:MAG TPA: 2-hydroxyacid dehydrogenase [Acidimicrobiia bacterium]|jgi:D-lactate dehydrogenase
MRVAVFSTKSYDREFLAALEHSHEMRYLEPRLDRTTALLAEGCEGACLFVNDTADREALTGLAEAGVRYLALRSAGFNNVDLDAARDLGFRVARVPGYSPYAVAEHAVALILALDRRIHRAYARVREGNFSLEGLLGFDLRLRTVGIVGTGKIGHAVATILRGFGCRLLAYDVHQNPDCLSLGVEYVELDRLFSESDVITLHCPLTPETHHLIDEQAISKMKPGVMIINTSRGALVDTPAAIEGLKSRRIGHLGLDVYEEEGDLFFEDQSDRVITDDVFSRLLTFPNVIVTGHQAFFTRNALSEIARVTGENLDAFEAGAVSPNDLT